MELHDGARHRLCVAAACDFFRAKPLRGSRPEPAEYEQGPAPLGTPRTWSLHTRCACASWVGRLLPHLLGRAAGRRSNSVHVDPFKPAETAPKRPEPQTQFESAWSRLA